METELEWDEIPTREDVEAMLAEQVEAGTDVGRLTLGDMVVVAWNNWRDLQAERRESSRMLTALEVVLADVKNLEYQHGAMGSHFGQLAAVARRAIRGDDL